MKKEKNNTKPLKRSDAAKLTEGIFLLIESMNSLSSNQDLIDKSLELLCRMSIIHSTAFVKMGQETYEFSLNSVYPSISRKYFEEVFNDISSSGELGIVFQGSGYYLSEKSFDDKNIFMLPVQSTKNIIGVLVLSIDKDYAASLSIEIINLLRILAKGIGLSYENAVLTANKESTQQLIEQLVASRTVELVENNQKLNEKIQSLTDNISMSIPHEIRTPINEILGTAKYLQSFVQDYNSVRSSDKDDVLDLLSDITNSASRLRNLFENFIYHTKLSLISTSLSKIENLQSKVSLNCDSIIYEQAMLKAIRYERKDDMEINLVTANIKMSEEYLMKLTDEVVDNALKYSKPGSKIKVSSTIQKDFYCWKIKDYGIGMPQEYINIFDSYKQYNRKAYEQQGLGLGLSIIFKIVDLHNGTMTIESKIDEYTNIHINIPLAIV